MGHGRPPLINIIHMYGKKTRGCYRWKNKNKSLHDQRSSTPILQKKSPQKPQIYKLSKEDFCGPVTEVQHVCKPRGKKRDQKTTANITAETNLTSRQKPVIVENLQQKMEVEPQETVSTQSSSTPSIAQRVLNSSVGIQQPLSPIPETSQNSKKTQPAATNNITQAFASLTISQVPSLTSIPVIPGQAQIISVVRTEEQHLEEYVEYCRLYLTKKDERGNWFEGLIKEHISISIVPKALTKFGERLIQNGIFLAAYIRFQKDYKKNVANIDRLLVSCFNTARTDIQVLQNLVHVLQTTKNICDDPSNWGKLLNLNVLETTIKGSKDDERFNQNSNHNKSINFGEGRFDQKKLYESSARKRTVMSREERAIKRQQANPIAVEQNPAAQICEQRIIKVEEAQPRDSSPNPTPEGTPEPSEAVKLAEKLKIQQQIIILKLYLQYHNEILACQHIAKILKKKVAYVQKQMGKILKLYDKRKHESNYDYVKRVISKLEGSMSKRKER